MTGATLAAITALWICTALAAITRDASAAVADQSDQGPPQGSLQEIVVTATKRAERLQDVPAAVSAITGEALQEMSADSFTDYARTVPGLTFTDYGAGRQHPTIRGSTLAVP